MITGARQHEDDVATVRLAQAIDLMVNERNPDRLCEIALEAACELCGAEGGEVVRLNDVGVPEPTARIGELPGGELGSKVLVFCDLVPCDGLPHHFTCGAKRSLIRCDEDKSVAESPLRSATAHEGVVHRIARQRAIAFHRQK